MKKPWVIGILSLIPGLGFLVLGKFWQGLIVFILSAGFGFLGWLTTRWETLSLILYTLAFLTWCIQWYFALLIAKSQARTKAGLDLPVREVTLEPLPQGASLGEKHLHKVRKIVLELLNPEENLKVALEGRTGTSPLHETLIDGPSTNIRVVYLGVTDEHLVFINTDRLGKPETLRRITFNWVTPVQFREGLIADWMELDIGEKKSLSIELPKSSREASRQLLALLKT